MLRGFTAQMLSELDAFSSRKVKPSTLNIPINHVLALDCWMAKPACDPPDTDYRLGGDTVWIAKNAWSHLEPCLKVTTIPLRNIHKHLWVSHGFSCLLSVSVADQGLVQCIDDGESEISMRLDFPLRINYKLHWWIFNAITKIKLRGIQTPSKIEECREATRNLIEDVLAKRLHLDFSRLLKYPCLPLNSRLDNYWAHCSFHSSGPYC